MSSGFRELLLAPFGRYPAAIAVLEAARELAGGTR